MTFPSYYSNHEFLGKICSLIILNYTLNLFNSMILLIFDCIFLESADEKEKEVLEEKKKKDKKVLTDRSRKSKKRRRRRRRRKKGAGFTTTDDEDSDLEVYHIILCKQFCNRFLIFESFLLHTFFILF